MRRRLKALPNVTCPVDCSTCVPLSRAACNRCVVVVGIEGGRTLRRRLAELGLSTGSQLRVIQNHGGPLVVAVKDDARMAIGRGMANKMLVRVAEEQPA